MFLGRIRREWQKEFCAASVFIYRIIVIMGYFFVQNPTVYCMNGLLYCLQAFLHFIQYIQLTSAADQCVDPCRVNVGMSEQIGETDNILLSPVIVDREEVTKIMGEDLLPAHIGSCAQRFHPVKDVAAVNGLSRSGHKDTARIDLAFPAVAAEFFAKLRGDQHLPGLTLEGDKCAPGAHRSDCYKLQLADTDPRRRNGFHDIEDLQISLFLRSTKEPAVFLNGELALFISERCALRPEGPDPAVFPSHELKKLVECRKHGIRAAQPVFVPEHLLEPDHPALVNLPV